MLHINKLDKENLERYMTCSSPSVSGGFQFSQLKHGTILWWGRMFEDITQTQMSFRIKVYI